MYFLSDLSLAHKQGLLLLPAEGQAPQGLSSWPNWQDSVLLSRGPRAWNTPLWGQFVGKAYLKHCLKFPKVVFGLNFYAASRILDQETQAGRRTIQATQPTKPWEGLSGHMAPALDVHHTPGTSPVRPTLTQSPPSVLSPPLTRPGWRSQVTPYAPSPGQGSLTKGQ